MTLSTSYYYSRRGRRGGGRGVGRGGPTSNIANYSLSRVNSNNDNDNFNGNMYSYNRKSNGSAASTNNGEIATSTIATAHSYRGRGGGSKKWTLSSATIRTTLNSNNDNKNTTTNDAAVSSAALVEVSMPMTDTTSASSLTTSTVETTTTEATKTLTSTATARSPATATAALSATAAATIHSTEASSAAIIGEATTHSNRTAAQLEIKSAPPMEITNLIDTRKTTNNKKATLADLVNAASTKSALLVTTKGPGSESVSGTTKHDSVVAASSPTFSVNPAVIHRPVLKGPTCLKKQINGTNNKINNKNTWNRSLQNQQTRQQKQQSSGNGIPSYDYTSTNSSYSYSRNQGKNKIKRIHNNDDPSSTISSQTNITMKTSNESSDTDNFPGNEVMVSTETDDSKIVADKNNASDKTSGSTISDAQQQLKKLGSFKLVARATKPTTKTTNNQQNVRIGSVENKAGNTEGGVNNGNSDVKGGINTIDSSNGVSSQQDFDVSRSYKNNLVLLTRRRAGPAPAKPTATTNTMATATPIIQSTRGRSRQRLRPANTCMNNATSTGGPAAKRIKLSVPISPHSGEADAPADLESSSNNNIHGQFAENESQNNLQNSHISREEETLTDFAYRETSTNIIRSGRGGAAAKVKSSRSIHKATNNSSTYNKNINYNVKKNMGLVRIQPDITRTPVCPTFLRGEICKDEKCMKRHDVPRECAMPICSFFQRNGQCSKGNECKFRHIKVNPRTMVCPNFSLLGFCEDKDCLMKHLNEKKIRKTTAAASSPSAT